VGAIAISVPSVAGTTLVLSSIPTTSLQSQSPKRNPVGLAPKHDISGSGESAGLGCPSEITVALMFEGDYYVGEATIDYSSLFYTTYEYIAWGDEGAVQGTATFDAIDCVLMWTVGHASTLDYTVERANY
jgi:hypothetical protein